MKEILDRIIRIRATQSRVLVAIDGYGGAGKSTLARKLTKKLQCATQIEFDWFHLLRSEVNNDYRYDFKRFKDEIANPFLEGKETLRFKKYNWGYLAKEPEALTDETLSLKGVTLLIVEGCMTLSSNLSDLFALKVWVGDDPVQARNQGVRRDIDEYGLNEREVLDTWQEWREWESRCLAQENRIAIADIEI